MCVNVFVCVCAFCGGDPRRGGLGSSSLCLAVHLTLVQKDASPHQRMFLSQTHDSRSDILLVVFLFPFSSFYKTVIEIQLLINVSTYNIKSFQHFYFEIHFPQ